MILSPAAMIDRFEDPKRASLSAIRRAFGCGFDQARALRALVRQIPDPVLLLMQLGVSQSEAEAALRLGMCQSLARQSPRWVVSA